MIVIGHRGAAGAAPENTAASLSAGISAGAGCIEFDVRLSLDGVPFLMHDHTVDRTTDGRGPACSKTWRQLSRLDAGSWFSSRFAGEPVPSLEQAIELIGCRADMIIELKHESRGGVELAEKVLDLIGGAAISGDVTISSKNWGLLQTVRTFDPVIGLAPTVGFTEKGDPVKFALKMGAASIHVNRRLLGRRLMERAASAGIDIYTYVVNSESALARVRKQGAAGIVTDDPHHLLSLLKER